MDGGPGGDLLLQGWPGKGSPPTNLDHQKDKDTYRLSPQIWNANCRLPSHPISCSPGHSRGMVDIARCRGIADPGVKEGGSSV